MNNIARARCIVENFQRNYRPTGCCCFNNGVINPTFTIGTVTTGEPGSEAAASITGTPPNFVLNLVIPEGLTGEQGPAPTLAIGTVETGEPGSEAQVTIIPAN